MIDDDEKIKKITEACQQSFVSQAKFVVVVCSNPSRTKNLYGEDAEKWIKQQTGAAIENFLLKITESGLATCWVGYFVEDQIKEILNIPEGVNVEALFPIGYELEKPKTRKSKIDLDRILYFNKYGNSKMKSPTTAD
jgi:nitroreductase